MEKEILQYLQVKDKASDLKVSEDLSLELNEVRKNLKQLRDKKLLKATDGWDNKGCNTYTNIEITTKGAESLKRRDNQPRNTTSIKIGTNNGIVSTGSESKNTQKLKNITNKEENFLSKIFWWGMGILGAVIASAILYYFNLI